MVRLCSIAAVLLFFIGAVPSANAGAMYGVTGSGGSSSSLYTINATTGVATLVGATGMSHITGMDFDPTSGILYGIADSTSSPKLVTIDKSTGAATTVGNLGVGGGIPDISFDSTGALFGWTRTGDDLISIDKFTGAAVVVGDSGTATGQTGLAFAAGDTLYMKSNTVMYTINPMTGAATFFNSLSGSDAIPVNALEYVASADILYSINGAGGGVGRTSALSIIDPVSGTWTIVGDMGVSGMAAIAVDSVITAVPEPSSWLLLSFGAVTFAAVRRRTTRRRMVEKTI